MVQALPTKHDTLLSINITPRHLLILLLMLLIASIIEKKKKRANDVVYIVFVMQHTNTVLLRDESL
jgi:hypothetical protein